jgi:hypothetical protein
VQAELRITAPFSANTIQLYRAFPDRAFAILKASNRDPKEYIANSSRRTITNLLEVEVLFCDLI